MRAPEQGDKNAISIYIYGSVPEEGLELST